jgi:exodeoxyribonuclease V alpha subunit
MFADLRICRWRLMAVDGLKRPFCGHRVGTVWALAADPGRLAQVADGPHNRPALQAAFNAAARRTAEHAQPEHATLRAAAHAAHRAEDQARRAVAEAARRLDHQLGRYGALGRTRTPWRR